MPINKHCQGILRLSFDDISEKNTDWPFSEILFDETMAKSVIDFAEASSGAIDHLLVHCNAGVSRSAAVAICLGELYGVPVVDAKKTPCSAPNKLVLRILRETISAI